MCDMDRITTEFAEHICDNLCKYPNAVSEDELEEHCSNCKMVKFICDILNEHNKINDFEKTQSYKLLAKLSEVRELVNEYERNNA